MEIYKSQFIEIQFFEKDSIIRNAWNPNTCIMQENEFKFEMLKMVEVIAEFKPKYLLSNASELFFNMSPALQSWVMEQFIEKIFSHDVAKIGVVLSKETFDQQNIQNKIDKTIDLQLHYFSSELEAKVWFERF